MLQEGLRKMLLVALRYVPTIETDPTDILIARPI